MDQPPPTLDALLPREMARRAEDVGVVKAALPLLQMAFLISLGAVLPPPFRPDRACRSGLDD